MRKVMIYILNIKYSTVSKFIRLYMAHKLRKLGIGHRDVPQLSPEEFKKLLDKYK